MQEERHTTVLRLLLSVAVWLLGLLAGYPLGNIARHALSGENIALPQQE
jgi:hypothetical protein